MSNSVKRLVQLLHDDPRYKLEAYVFVEDGLAFAAQYLKMGSGPPVDSGDPDRESEDRNLDEFAEAKDEVPPTPRRKGRARRERRGPGRHVTGQELCEALRLFALEQYGLMAKLVLASWGLHSTRDFGEIVYNLIRIGRLRKSDTDRQEDFENVFDFEDGFCRRFQITIPADEPGQADEPGKEE